MYAYLKSNEVLLAFLAVLFLAGFLLTRDQKLAEFIGLTLAALFGLMRSSSGGDRGGGGQP